MQIACENCGGESFAFQVFRELPLDLLSLEKNAKIRHLFYRIYGKRSKKKPKQSTSKMQLGHFGVENGAGRPNAAQRNRNLKSSIEVKKIQKSKASFSSINFRPGGFAPKKLSRANKASRPSRSAVSSKLRRMQSTPDNTHGNYVRMGSGELSRRRQPKQPQTFNPYQKNPFPDVFLSELVKDFFAPDYVKDYFCFHCRQKSTVKKSLFILQEPEVLLLSLKRFVSEPQPVKVHRPVFIYKDVLDLGEYLFRPEAFLDVALDLHDSGVASRRRPNAEVTYNDSVSFNRSIMQRGTLFEMTGYVEHVGDLSRGHYVAFVRNDVIQGKMKVRDESVEHEWFLVNDQKVYRVKDHAKKLQMYNAAVYSIFYKKKRSTL